MKANHIILFIFCFQIACSSKHKIESFKTWAPTPPMGWNSWDCFGPTVEEHEVKANADYMAANMKSYGWEFIVVDIRWFVENDKAGGYNQKDPRYVMDEYGRYLPATNRFPSAKNGKGFSDLAKYIHQKGLKFGIHIMRGIPKKAVENKMPIKGTNNITADQIYTTELQCPWLKDNYTIMADKKGAQEYYNSIFELYASWGVDFIKIDDLSQPYHQAEIELIRKAIDKCGKKIVLSTSPGETPIESAMHIKKHANMWRMVDDVWDTWPHVRHLFDIAPKWAPYISSGSWPDCDMIPLGRISVRGERGNVRMSRLTKDEQYTLMNLWTIFRSPLFFGGDLPSNDVFTLGLLTNSAVIKITQQSKNNRLILQEDNQQIWMAEDAKSNTKYAALFAFTDGQAIKENLALYSTSLLTHKKGNQSSEINIKIGNAKKLFLVVTDGGDGNAWDHANWLEPKLSGRKGTLNLTDLQWKKANAGWGEIQINKSIGETSLNVENENYTNGIGTHSNSIIEYDIPEGYDTFTAKVGLDKNCISHSEGATVKFHLFTQYPTGQKPSESLNMKLDFKKIGLQGNCEVIDIWTGNSLGIFKDDITLNIKNHGSRLISIIKK